MYGSIGKLGLTTSELTTNQAIAFAVPDPEVVEARFLFYYLLGQREALSAAGKGATQRNIGQGTLKPWHIPLPPLLEQRRIVEILEDHLSRLDAAEELLARSRDRLRPLGLLELQQSMDQSGALDVPLSAFVERVEAGRSFGGSAPSARADEWGIVKVSAMTWGAFRPSENKAVPTVAVDPRFEIKPGDLLVSRANTTAYVGAAVLVGETRPKLLLSDKSLRIVARPGIDPRWLLAALTSPRARTQISALATGTKDSMRNISQANLLGVRLPDEGADGRSRVVQDREQSADRGARLAAEWQEFTATPTPVLVQRDPRLYLIARTIHQRTNQALEFLLQNGLPVQVLKIAFYLDEGGRRFLDVEWDSEPESSGPVPGSATTVLVLDDPEAVAEPRDFREVTLSEVAAVVPTPATLVWLRPRKNIRYEATLLDNGVIRLPSGVEHRSPSGAAMAVADVVSYDGWYAWRVGDHGPTLNELRMEVAAGASPSAQPTAT